jgi:hypothetical protein
MISIFSTLFPSGVTFLALLEIIVALVVVWIIASIPAYIAGKVVTKGRATFGEAMAATLLGPIVYILVLVVVDFFLGLAGTGGYIVGFILAFIAWIGVYKATFRTGWLGALATAILTTIIFVILLIIIAVLFGFVPQLLPTSLQKF